MLGSTNLQSPYTTSPTRFVAPTNILETLTTPISITGTATGGLTRGGGDSPNLHRRSRRDATRGRGGTHGHGRRIRGRRGQGGGHRNGRQPGRGGRFSHRRCSRHSRRWTMLRRWGMQQLRRWIGGGGRKLRTPARGRGVCRGGPVLTGGSRGRRHSTGGGSKRKRRPTIDRGRDRGFRPGLDLRGMASRRSRRVTGHRLLRRRTTDALTREPLAQHH
jgi:hypothetical protein